MTENYLCHAKAEDALNAIHRGEDWRQTVEGQRTAMSSFESEIAAPAGIIAMVAALAAALIQIASANGQLDDAIDGAKSQLAGVAQKAADWPRFAAV